MSRIDCSIDEIKKNGILLEDYLGKRLDNKESKLYVYNENLTKILNMCLRYNRTQIIEWFHSNKKEFPIALNDTLYEFGNLFGYSMKLYKNSNTLYDFLSSDVDLHERKMVALRLVKLYEKLLKNKIYFYDWHSKNFLLEDDIVFLDFDSCEVSRFLSTDKLYRRYLMELCLSILTGIDLDFDLNTSKFEAIKLFRDLIDCKDKQP